MAANSNSLSQQLSAHLMSIRYEDLPSEVVSHAKLLLLDLFGVVLGAHGSPEADIMLDSFVQTHLDQKSGSLLWGTNKFASMPDAALFNGTLAHVLELDDFGGADHSGAVVIPALIAVAKGEGGISGRKLIEALVIGYEASRRTLEAAGAYRGHNNVGGWHSTGTCGAVGAACAVAHILNLPIGQMVSAMGFSLTMAGGTWAFQQDGAMSKRLHSGWAAHLGVFAAQLARSGLTGPIFAYEAEWGGFLNTYAKESRDPDKLLGNFGDWFRLLRSGIKPYPCCRDNHSTIDVMIELHQKLDGDVSQIQSVDIGCIPEMVQMLNNRNPETVLDAQLSLPHCSSVALLRGRVQLADFHLDQLQDEKILAVKQQIHLSENNDLPFDSEPLIKVTFADGTAETFTVPYAKGAPQNPLTVAEVRAKFEMLTHKLLTADTQTALWQAIDQIETCEDVASLEQYLVVKATD